MNITECTSFYVPVLCVAAAPVDVATSQDRQQCSIVAEALKRGKLGFGFSAGGLLFPYYLGIVQTLSELNVITGTTYRLLCTF